MRFMGLDAKVGNEGGGINRGGLGANARGKRKILLHELLKRRGIRASNDREDVGDVARRLALEGHAVGNLSGRNLKRLLRGRKPKVVERLSRLRECENDLGFLRALALGGEGGGGTLGSFESGGGSLVVFHMLHALAVEVREAELPLAGMEVSMATRARKPYFLSEVFLMHEISC